MEKVRRVFLIFCALLISFHLLSDPRQAYYSGPLPASFSLFEENGKVGLKNEQGKVVIPAQYEAIGWSNGSFSLLANVTGYLAKGKWGLINIENNKITKTEFEDLTPAQGNLIIARKKMPGTVKVLAGCINTSGKQIIPFQYDGLKVNSFRAIAFIRAANQFKYGLIDLQNNVLIPLNYRNIYSLGSLRYGVEDFAGKIAIYSEDGRAITGFDIDSISTFKKDLAIIYHDQHEGLMDREGTVKMQPALQSIRIMDDGTVHVKPADQWIFLDGENHPLSSVNADSITWITESLLKVKANGKYHLLDERFKPQANSWFEYIGGLSDGKFVAKSRGKYGLINSTGDWLIKPLYHSLRVDNGVAIVQPVSDHQYALIDLQGKSLSYRSYRSIGPFNGKFFPVTNRGFSGGIDKAGNEIIPCTHDSVGQVFNDRVVVKFKGKYGVINLSEDWIITPQSEKIQLLTEDRYFTHRGETTFLRDNSGQVIYFSDNVLEFKRDHILEHVSDGGTWKIALNGQVIERTEKPEAVQAIYPESEGLRAIKKDNRFGFVDNRGRLRIANRYEEVKDFHNGLAAVRILGKWGFINKADQIAIQPVYEEVNSFTENYSIVKQKSLLGLIDKSGKLILPVRYQSIEILPGHRFKVKQNDLWGLSDINGSLIIQPKLDFLEDLNNGYVIIGREGKFGVLTLQGLSTIPQIYDGIFYDQVRKNFVGHLVASWKTVNP